MQQLSLDIDAETGPNLLFLGAHCDDIEIGCGGAVLKLTDKYKNCKVKWVVFASSPIRKIEAENAAKAFLADIDNKEIIVFGYKDSYLEQEKFEIKSNFEDLKKSFDPDIVFTHYRNDLHQDHRLISELTWNTFRNHLILEYEIPKYDGDLGQPNFFITLTKESAKRKVEIILDSYHSQSSKHWFDAECFLSLMRIRGLESANAEKYSEAFYMRKAVF